MSLFASLQGDIWSLSGISFASPINDLLDRGGFNLDDLLNEDELIQEVKSKNDRLLEFLCTEKGVDQLITYVIQPANDSESLQRKFRYPYMSCEVICCEVPDLLSILVEERNGHYLDRLFQFLDQPADQELDSHLAGYFEKILEMLFRKMTVPMMTYFNSKELTLFRRFLRHIRNYSVMQIVQRLMLPHLPFSNPGDSELLSFDEQQGTAGAGGGLLEQQCNWSFSPEACELLLAAMLGESQEEGQAGDEEVPPHVSDMLITVLQLSPPETVLVRFLCLPESVHRLLVAATSTAIANQDPEESSKPSEAMRAAVALAAASVLESLVSRLFESGFPLAAMLSTANENNGGNGNGNGNNNHGLEDGGMGGMQEAMGQGQQLSEQEQEAAAMVQEQIAAVCQEIAPMLPRLSTVLASLLPEENNDNEATVDTKKLRFQTQSLHPAPRLGHLGLQLVKVTEALLRLGNPLVDAACLSAGLLPLCLRLFLAFEFNSVLHLSVQRILVAVLEPQPPIATYDNANEGSSSSSVRSALQVHLLSEAGLLQVLMDQVGGLNRSPSEDQQQQAAAAAGDVNPLLYRPAWLKPATALTTVDGFVFAARHSSVVGHLIPVAHAVYLLLSGKEEDEDGNNNGAANNSDNSQQTLQDPSPLSAVTSPLYSRQVSDGSGGGGSKEGMNGGEDCLTEVGDVHHQGMAVIAVNEDNIMMEEQPAISVMMMPAAVILNDRQARAMQLRDAIGDGILLAAWDGFVETRFKAVLEQQSIPPLQQESGQGGQGQQLTGIGLQGLAHPDDMDLPPDIDDDVFGGERGGEDHGRGERHHSNPPLPEPRVMRGDFDEDDEDDDDDEIDGDYRPRYRQHHQSYAQVQQQQQQSGQAVESDDSDDWGDSSNNNSGNSFGNDSGGGDWADFSALDASLPSPPPALAATGRFEPGQLGQGGEDPEQQPVVFEAFADFADFDEIVPPLPPPFATAQEEAKDTALFEEDKL